MPETELSVILCTYNRGEKLSSVLNDFANQVFPEGSFPWELVLVDNNSNDGTKGLAEQYKKDRNLPIRYVFESQQGKSFALNRGIENAAGDLLAFTDDDVILDAQWLCSIYRAFRSYPNNNCFGGKVLPVIEGALPAWLKGTGRYSVGGGPLVKHDRGDQVREYDEKMWVPIGSNMFFRKEMVRKFGHFSTALGFYNQNELIYGEDSEIMFRFKRGGERILYYPGSLVYHPVPSGRLRKSYFKKYSWGAGRGGARWLQVPPGSVTHFNVPRYLIRRMLSDFAGLMASIPSPKEYKRVSFELKLLYDLGMIYEFYINGD
jgi:glycosyltransferase involved in cell wall biosynthesis